jgi:hypothetical protein
VKRLAGWLSAYLELELDEQQLAELDGIIEEQLPPISRLSRRMAEATRGSLIQRCDMEYPSSRWIEGPLDPSTRPSLRSSLAPA